MADPHASGDTSYQRGSQEISEQVSTFDLVMGLTKWGALGVVAVVLFAFLILMPGGNFFGALLPALALIAVGIFLLRGKKSH